jgi:hypothetical protein
MKRKDTGIGLHLFCEKKAEVSYNNDEVAVPSSDITVIVKSKQLKVNFRRGSPASG